jgi:hypothetical protein
MKKLAAEIICVLVLIAPHASFANKPSANETGGGSHRVKGHFKKDGTYVAPHRSTNPNHTQRDNWSSKPNVNPYNGKQGTKEPKH